MSQCLYIYTISFYHTETQFHTWSHLCGSNSSENLKTSDISCHNCALQIEKNDLHSFLSTYSLYIFHHAANTENYY